MPYIMSITYSLFLEEVKIKEYTVKMIHSDKAPKAIGCYSQAIQTEDNYLFLSGQIGLDPKTMTLVDPSFELQCHQVFKNMQAVLEQAGLTFANIVKLSIFIINMDEFPILNEVMKAYFQQPYPARSTIAVSRLPKDAAVEIEAIARA